MMILLAVAGFVIVGSVLAVALLAGAAHLDEVEARMLGEREDARRASRANHEIRAS